MPAGVQVGVLCAEGHVIDAADLKKIEELDDVIFAALDGEPDALDKSARLWNKLRDEAPAELVDESREQYLRRAEAVIERYQDEPLDALGPAFAALEILALLAD